METLKPENKTLDCREKYSLYDKLLQLDILIS